MVDELALDAFANRGNFLILRVQKVELSTWEMIDIIASYLGIYASKIGYAGLKDKHATTTQYISIEQKYESNLDKFSHTQIKILEKFKDTKSIKLGDLKGNRFSINLYKLDAIKSGKVEKIARKIAKNGLLNYFGYQRFGHDKSSITQAKDLINGEIFIEDAKLRNFLISIYQSYLFNEWLSYRVRMAKESNLNVIESLEGDILRVKDRYIYFNPMQKQTGTLTGLLCGRGILRAKAKAREIEELFDDEFLQDEGSRRDAIVYPYDIVAKFDMTKKVLKLSFSMPKGSYATVFLESISGKNYDASMVKKQK